MNPANLLALISDLYGQIVALQQRNAELEAELAQREEPDAAAEG